LRSGSVTPQDADGDDALCLDFCNANPGSVVSFDADVALAARPQQEPASRWSGVFLPDLGAEVLSAAAIRRAAAVGFLWPSNGATGADERAIAVRRVGWPGAQVKYELIAAAGVVSGRRDGGLGPPKVVGELGRRCRLCVTCLG
jgi:hypothetical protein